MRGAVLYGPRDVRFEERDLPKILKPTDASSKSLPRACVGRIYGRIVAFSRLPNPPPWGMSTVARPPGDGRAAAIKALLRP
jgi:hypothetical protein